MSKNKKKDKKNEIANSTPKKPIIERILEENNISLNVDDTLLEKTIAINLKTEEQKAKKLNKKFIIIPIITIILIIPIIVYFLIRPKFQDVQIELGNKEITAETFIVSNLYKKHAIMLTNIDEVDLTTPGEKEIALSYNDNVEVVKLKVVDTTAPKVEFQNLNKTFGYEMNVDDFILSKEDESPMKVELIENKEIKEGTEYRLKIKVSDTSGNETIGECTLKISWLISSLEVELGDKFKLEDILLDTDKYSQYVDKSSLKKVNTNKAGEYIVKASYNDEEYTSTIIVKDTTPPTLKLKSLKIYNDEESLNYKKFISKVSDASGDVKTTLKTDIKFGKVGKQEITIEATDSSGNKTIKTTTLTIRKDTTGPIFSGLSAKTVKKNAKIDYNSGVSATDAKDGKCTFSVDTSKLDLTKAGTYYVTYTSKDKSGNKTTKKRKITVLHDASDTERKFNEFYNKYLSGKKPEQMAKEIWRRIGASSDWGGDDPVWYGLTNGKGNCYVHTKLLQKALTKAGYQNQIIYTTNKSHYWNLVKVNGVWRHLDSTPLFNTSLLTDSQKLTQPELQGHDWDHSKWPAAV